MDPIVKRKASIKEARTHQTAIKHYYLTIQRDQAVNFAQIDREIAGLQARRERMVKELAEAPMKVAACDRALAALDREDRDTVNAPLLSKIEKLREKLAKLEKEAE